VAVGVGGDDGRVVHDVFSVRLYYQLDNYYLAKLERD
jgi:hypothetical protein